MRKDPHGKMHLDSMGATAALVDTNASLGGNSPAESSNGTMRARQWSRRRQPAANELVLDRIGDETSGRLKPITMNPCWARQLV